MILVYVNELGPNYKGDNIYEFIFSDLDDVWGEDWDAEPASGKPLPPDVNYIKKVGVLKNSDIELTLIQNSDFFGLYDAIDGEWFSGNLMKTIVGKISSQLKSWCTVPVNSKQEICKVKSKEEMKYGI
jgi:hypothetical protein